MKKASLNISFIAASISFLMVFAASATPIPLYDIYRIEDHLTYNDLALTAVVYFIGAITSLLIFGRISDYLGRKPVAYIIFALTSVATILLLDVTNATILIIARLLLGFACGLASSSITSYIVDHGTNLPQWVTATIVSNSPMIGLTIGALISGSLVEFAPYQRILCYIFILIVLFICTILIVKSEETVQKRPGLLKSLKPEFSLPKSSKKVFPIAAVVFITTWAMGAFYQAFGPSIAVDQLGTHNTLIIAILFGSYLLPSAIGGPLSAKLHPVDAQRVGMFCFSFGVLGIIFSLKLTNLYLFIIFSAIAGVSQGAALTGSIRSVMKDVTISERAGILSLIYATSYVGAAIPSFIAGQLSHYMDLFHVSIFYGVLAIIACVLTLTFAKKPKQMEVSNG